MPVQIGDPDRHRDQHLDQVVRGFVMNPGLADGAGSFRVDGAGSSGRRGAAGGGAVSGTAGRPAAGVGVAVGVGWLRGGDGVRDSLAMPDSMADPARPAARIFGVRCRASAGGASGRCP